MSEKWKERLLIYPVVVLLIGANWVFDLDDRILSFIGWRDDVASSPRAESSESKVAVLELSRPTEIGDHIEVTVLPVGLARNAGKIVRVPTEDYEAMLAAADNKALLERDIQILVSGFCEGLPGPKLIAWLESQENATHQQAGQNLKQARETGRLQLSAQLNACSSTLVFNKFCRQDKND